MMNNLRHLVCNGQVMGLFELVAEAMFLERTTQVSLVDWNVSNAVLLGEIGINAQESV